jgi:hypothetical protein
LNDLIEKEDQKHELNMIIQNFQESIVIITQNKMELVNQKFLNQFGILLLDEDLKD